MAFRDAHDLIAPHDGALPTCWSSVTRSGSYVP